MNNKPKKVSHRQETSVAREMGADIVIASGALWGAKGDVRNDRYLIECKTTSKDYYTITAKVWDKICREALKDRMRDPLLVIDLHNNTKERYVCFPFDLIPFSLEDDSATPLWLRGNITNVKGDSKQFRFFGVRKHTATVVSFYSTKRKKYNTVVLMTFKDFDRFDREVLDPKGGMTFEV